MFTKKTTAALFTIAIVSSLLVVSGGVLGSTLAAAKKVTNENEDNAFKTLSNDKTNTQLQTTDDAGDSNGSTGDRASVSAKDLKSLSKCQSDAAADGDLTSAEAADCYRQVF